MHDADANSASRVRRSAALRWQEAVMQTMTMLESTRASPSWASVQHRCQDATDHVIASSTASPTVSDHERAVSAVKGRAAEGREAAAVQTIPR